MEKYHQKRFTDILDGSNRFFIEVLRQDGRGAFVKIVKKVNGLGTFWKKIFQVAKSVKTVEEVICRDYSGFLRFLTEKLYSFDGIREIESFMHPQIEGEVFF